MRREKREERGRGDERRGDESTVRSGEEKREEERTADWNQKVERGNIEYNRDK